MPTLGMKRQIFQVLWCRHVTVQPCDRAELPGDVVRGAICILW